MYNTLMQNRSTKNQDDIQKKTDEEKHENTSENKQILNIPAKYLPIIPLTTKEIHEAAKARVSLIAKEFSKGFNFLSKYPQSVTFFGGSRFTEDSHYYTQARSLASRIVKDLHYSVYTGGGPGIMEAANRGAFEAGGESLGLTIEIPTHQATNPYLTDHLDLYYFFSRKVCMSFSAEAYLFFPGGIGTLDEFFEILTLVQTHKIERMPIILVGSDFWNGVDIFIKKELLERKTIDTEDTELYTISDNEDKIIELIRNAPVRNGLKFSYVAPNETHPKKTSEKLASKHCEPCEKNTDEQGNKIEPLLHDASEKLLSETHNWSLIEDTSIEKIFDFHNFEEAMSFTNEVGKLAEDEGHHPDIHVIEYKHVKISLTTHNLGGLSENDFIMAAKIDELRRK